jgi:hypothetical protein
MLHLYCENLEIEGFQDEMLSDVSILLWKRGTTAYPGMSIVF